MKQNKIIQKSLMCLHKRILLGEQEKENIIRTNLDSEPIEFVTW